MYAYVSRTQNFACIIDAEFSNHIQRRWAPQILHIIYNVHLFICSYHHRCRRRRCCLFDRHCKREKLPIHKACRLENFF